MKKFLIIFTLMVLVSAIYAGDDSRKGTTGADQLLIPVGARGIATGGAFLANLQGLESIYYNPAGFAKTKYSEAMFSYMTYIADINVSYFAAGASLGDFGSIGVTFKSLDFGDIDVTTSQFPDGTGEQYSPTYIVAGLTYSKIITDKISVGTNIKLINESIMNTSATGVGVDVGIQYKFDDRLSLGAAVKNIGSNMDYSGADLQQETEIPDVNLGTRGGQQEVVTESFQLPSSFEMSLAYKLPINPQNYINFGGTYLANNALEDIINLGAEYAFMDILFLRGGYNYMTSNADEYIYGFTAGAGVNYKVSTDVGINVDYAFRQVKEFPTSNHVMTVKFAFMY